LFYFNRVRSDSSADRIVVRSPEHWRTYVHVRVPAAWSQTLSDAADFANAGEQLLASVPTTTVVRHQ
jgi:hypothetical protein